jgi:predicted DsbA family dithiol-disulfide isomerase
VEEAYDAGISATPSWYIDDRLVIPGVQDRTYYEHMVNRLRAKQLSDGS